MWHISLWFCKFSFAFIFSARPEEKPTEKYTWCPMVQIIEAQARTAITVVWVRQGLIVPFDAQNKFGPTETPRISLSNSIWVWHHIHMKIDATVLENGDTDVRNSTHASNEEVRWIIKKNIISVYHHSLMLVTHRFYQANSNLNETDYLLFAGLVTFLMVEEV